MSDPSTNYTFNSDECVGNRKIKNVEDHIETNVGAVHS